MPQFATVGDDKFLRIWSTYDRKQVRCSRLEMPSRAVAYSPDGARLCVGFGSPSALKSAARSFDGKFVIMDASDFGIAHEARDSQKWISEIKYAPEGTSLAVGSWDARIYVYSLENGQLTLANMITQHNSWIRHVDFAAHGPGAQYLRANCGAHELCFFEADTGMYIPAASRLKDQKWATHTCAMTWESQGCWPAANSGVDVTALDVAQGGAGSGNSTIACGDNFGRVRLFRSPSTSSLAKCVEYRAHSAQVTKVRWSQGCQHVLTCSADDRCVMQWARKVDDVATEEQAQARALKKKLQATDAANARAAKSNKSNANAANAGTTPKAVASAQLAASIDALPSRDLAREEEDSDEEHEQRGAVMKSRAWLLAACPPSNARMKPDVTAPALTATLEWVHGCQASDVRSQCCYTASGEVVYPISRLAVVYSKEEHSQRFYRGHEHALSALAASPTGRFIASGERAKRPAIHVWCATARRNAATLGPLYHRGAVAALAFSGDASRLVSVGRDTDGSLVVWRSPSKEWDDAYPQAAVAASHAAVHFACFSNALTSATPLSGGGDVEHYALCSGGERSVLFWSLDGRELASKAPLWGGAQREPTTLCGCAVLDVFVTGTACGHLYVWKGRACEKSVRAHEHGLESIHAAPHHHHSGKCAGVVTGGRDGLVKLWSSSLAHLKTFDLSEAPVPPLLKAVTSVHVGLDAAGGVARVLVCCRSSELYECASKSGSIALLCEGHHSDELWALHAHPTDANVVATAGDDGTVRVWSLELRRLIRKCQLDGPIRALSWSPDGSQLLVGMGGSPSGARHAKDGIFLVLDASTLEVRHEGRDSRHWLRCAKFAPDGNTFALAGADQKLYVYDTKDTRLRSKSDKHNEAITHLDYSTDSALIQSDAADYEHLFHKVEDGTHVRVPSSVKDADFQASTCIFGWPVQGCWAALSGDQNRDATCETTAIARAHAHAFQASGDQNGNVRLHRYPAPQRALSLTNDHSHVSHVAAVQFTADDKYLVTVGRRDRSIAIWKLQFDEPAPPQAPTQPKSK